MYMGKGTRTLMWDGNDPWSEPRVILPVWFKILSVPAKDFLGNVERAQHERQKLEKAVAEQAAKTLAVMLEQAAAFAEEKRDRRARINKNNAKACAGIDVEAGAAVRPQIPTRPNTPPSPPAAKKQKIGICRTETLARDWLAKQKDLSPWLDDRYDFCWCPQCCEDRGDPTRTERLNNAKIACAAATETNDMYDSLSICTPTFCYEFGVKRSGASWGHNFFHGTNPENVASILQHGLKVPSRDATVFAGDKVINPVKTGKRGVVGLWASKSFVYAGFRVYAPGMWYEDPTKEEEFYSVSTIFRVIGDPGRITRRQKETVCFGDSWPGIKLDPLVPDDKVECCWNDAQAVQVTGLLVCINHETRDAELWREKRTNDDWVARGGWPGAPPPPPPGGGGGAARKGGGGGAAGGGGGAAGGGGGAAGGGGGVAGGGGGAAGGGGGAAGGGGGGGVFAPLAFHTQFRVVRGRGRKRDRTPQSIAADYNTAGEYMCYNPKDFCWTDPVISAFKRWSQKWEGIDVDRLTRNAFAGGGARLAYTITTFGVIITRQLTAQAFSSKVVPSIDKLGKWTQSDAQHQYDWMHNFQQLCSDAANCPAGGAHPV